MNRNVSESIVDRGSAPDWLVMLFGVLVAVLALVSDAVPTAWGILVGILVVGVAAWDMYRPSALAVILEAVTGALTFVLPWVGGFSGSSVAWLAWILGLLIIVGAAWSWASHPTN